MNPHDDLPPTDLTRLRSALEQRAGGDSPTQPAALLASAQRRAATLHRRFVASGALVALLCVGVIAGAVVANHGRATVGVSVAGPTGTTDAPTTTDGNPRSPMTPPCGDSFFSTTTWTSLADHFGTNLECSRVADTWLVSFRGPATTAAVLRCDPTDATCLDPDALHDFDAFTVVFLPPVGSDTSGLTSYTTSGGTSDVPVDLTWTWMPRLPPTPTPVSSLRISGPSTGVTLEYGLTCEPTDGPATSNWVGQPMDVMSGQQALAVPVPDWRSDVTGTTRPC